MTENCKKRRRITLKYKSPNPLFEQWLNEWKEEAKQRSSKSESTYRKALSSLKKCPIVFSSGQECKILKGFGDKLCHLLDQRLREHNSHLSDVQNIDSDDLGKNEEKVCEPMKKKKLPRNEIHGSKLEKDELLILESKNLNTIDGNIATKNIPEDVVVDIHELVQCQDYLDKLEKIGSDVDKFHSGSSGVLTSKVQSNDCNKSVESQVIQPNIDYYILQPGTFEIILLVDTAEIGTSDPLLKELNKLPGVCQHEVRKLNVGDYVWICQDKDSKKELVLPYIFERKRLDDFASSIKDGRYKEQKYRLKRSGIDNKYYLIEDYKKHVGLPITSLQQAAINTAVQDGFKIKLTSNLKHTANYLNKFTLLLTKTFKNKTLVRCLKNNIGHVDLSDDLISLMSFEELNQGGIKNKPLKVTDLFIRMLIQMKGMSVQRAIAITDCYPTPILLKKAITESDIDAIQKSISELTYEGQKVGISLSRTVVQLFTKTL